MNKFSKFKGFEFKCNIRNAFALPYQEIYRQQFLAKKSVLILSLIRDICDKIRKPVPKEIFVEGLKLVNKLLKAIN